MPKVNATLHQGFTRVSTAHFRGVANHGPQRKAEETSDAYEASPSTRVVTVKTDVDGDRGCLMAFKVSAGQEIVGDGTKGVTVCPSKSDERLAEIKQEKKELPISGRDIIVALDKLRCFCIEQDFDYAPVSDWICSLVQFVNSKLLPKKS